MSNYEKKYLKYKYKYLKYKKFLGGSAHPPIPDDQHHKIFSQDLINTVIASVARNIHILGCDLDKTLWPSQLLDNGKITDEFKDLLKKNIMAVLDFEKKDPKKYLFLPITGNSTLMAQQKFISPYTDNHDEYKLNLYERAGIYTGGSYARDLNGNILWVCDLNDIKYTIKRKKSSVVELILDWYDDLDSELLRPYCCIILFGMDKNRENEYVKYYHGSSYDAALRYSDALNVRKTKYGINELHRQFDDEYESLNLDEKMKLYGCLTKTDIIENSIITQIVFSFTKATDESEKTLATRFKNALESYFTSIKPHKVEDIVTGCGNDLNVMQLSIPLHEVDIGIKDLNKGTSLNRYIKAINDKRDLTLLLSLENTAVFGDAENDFEMFDPIKYGHEEKQVPLRVAMYISHESLYKKANIIANVHEVVNSINMV